MIGRTQRHVLLVLSTRGPSTCGDWAAWYPLDRGAVPGAMRRLYNRGLVEPTGFAGNSRLYGITSAGVAAIDGLDPDEEEGEE